MGRWMFSVCIMVVEAWGNVYFFDTFLGRKKGIFFCRYRFPAYLAMMFAASTAGYWIDMWKLPVYILGYILLGRVCYQAGWIQAIYFSMLNYSMIFLTDLMLVSLMDLWETQEAIWGIWSVPGALFAKACWIVFIFLFRRVWKEGADYGELTDGEWLKLGLLPCGEISPVDENSPTLTYNLIGRHQSRYVTTRVASVQSPWMLKSQVGDLHAIPVSHGEGRFVAPQAALDQLGLTTPAVFQLVLYLVAMAKLYAWGRYDLPVAKTDSQSAARLCSCVYLTAVIALCWLALLQTQDATIFAYFQF